MVNSIYELPEVYDMQYEDYDADIAFLLELASRYAGDTCILEFACGTGRVTIPMAQAGYSITGVDLSPMMLEFARGKVEALGNGVRLNTKLVQGDMRTYQTGKQHDFVFVPFTSFLHLLTRKDQLASLRNIHSHLTEDGRMIVDIFKPNVQWLARGVEKFKVPVLSKEVQLKSGGILQRYQTTSYDETNQIVDWTFVVKVYDSENELESEHIEQARVRVIFPDQWFELLEKAGFVIEHAYGDYEFTEFGKNSSRMLFVCKKA